ncbi:polysaccharide deacetylase family protein [Candidatus Parcubacteria bacterium]|nr:polysaccharide deacetylase family protein [Candidatus Parcubacteria bacterium]
MKFIITIDDADEKTLKLFLSERFNIPIVVGVPAGLIGKNFENRNIASKKLIFNAIQNLNIEIASHGYYHVTPAYNIRGKIEKTFSRVKSFPDKIDYFFRILHFFAFNKNDDDKKEIFEFEKNKEIIDSKNMLEKIFGKKIIAFLYPGGYFDKNIASSVSKNYTFARTSEIGPNLIEDLNNDSNKFLLNTISFSKYTNFSKIEKYYKRLLEEEKQGKKEILIIEAYHIISRSGSDRLYSCLFDDFKKHCEFLKSIGKINKFLDF